MPLEGPEWADVRSLEEKTAGHGGLTRLKPVKNGAWMLRLAQR